MVFSSGEKKYWSGALECRHEVEKRACDPHHFWSASTLSVERQPFVSYDRSFLSASI